MDMPNLLNDRFIGFKKALDEKQLSFPDSHRIIVNLLDMEELRQRILSTMALGLAIGGGVAVLTRRGGMV